MKIESETKYDIDDIVIYTDLKSEHTHSTFFIGKIVHLTISMNGKNFVYTYSISPYYTNIHYHYDERLEEEILLHVTQPEILELFK